MMSFFYSELNIIEVCMRSPFAGKHRETETAVGKTPPPGYGAGSLQVEKEPFGIGGSGCRLKERS